MPYHLKRRRKLVQTKRVARKHPAAGYDEKNPDPQFPVNAGMHMGKLKRKRRIKSES